MEIYLDNSATTKPYIEVVQAVGKCMMDFYGNPSSIHSLGEKAKKYLSECRKSIANTLNAEEEEIIFTSGGSESNNFLLKGLLKPGDHMITTNIEHSSILKCCSQLEALGVDVTYLRADDNGRIKLEELKKEIKKNTKLVSIMHVNNEIGVIQDIESIGKLIKEYNKNIKFHVDAVQSYGKLKIDVNKLNIDMLSISSHKIHGPRGVGAAYIRKGTDLASLISGGGQEFNLRSGTENLPGISGFAAAAEKMHKNMDTNFIKVCKLREYLINNIVNIKGIKINRGPEDYFLPHIVSISTVGLRSGKVLFYLDKRGIYVSKASACSSRNLTDSHVLKAINLNPDEILGSLRVSFSEENSFEDIDILIYHIDNFLRELKSNTGGTNV